MFTSILVPIDLGQPASWKFALPEAIELATASRGSMSVLTVVRDPRIMFEGICFSFQMEEIIRPARDKLAAIVSDLQLGRTQLHQEVRLGSIGHEIISAARERAVDLILMSSHRPEMRDYFIGPNAAYVAQHAPCSVLVLRKFGTLKVR